MKIFDRNKYNIKPEWVFNQKGNLWKFIFGGKDLIVGETRDLENKLLYLFVVKIQNGKKILSDFLFEDGNYWISLEGANSSIIFLHRFEKPELPYHKNIIALDVRSGRKLWENCEYQYFFSTENRLFGLKQKFNNPEIAEINLEDGLVKNVFREDEYLELLELKRKSDDDLYNEFYDYPKSLNHYPLENHISEIIRKETIKSEGEIEYIIKNDKVYFNYYIKADVDIKDIAGKYFINNFCVYDISSGRKIYQDVLNNKSSYNVPDNFFCRDNYIYYLKEKKDLVALKI